MKCAKHLISLAPVDGALDIFGTILQNITAADYRHHWRRKARDRHHFHNHLVATELDVECKHVCSYFLNDAINSTACHTSISREHIKEIYIEFDLFFFCGFALHSHSRFYLILCFLHFFVSLKISPLNIIHNNHPHDDGKMETNIESMSPAQNFTTFNGQKRKKSSVQKKKKWKKTLIKSVDMYRVPWV